MATPKCRYCGQSDSVGRSCYKSPKGKCVAVADGEHCIYCGQKNTTGRSCSKSPSGKCQLDI
jgi:hypothetical protein